MYNTELFEIIGLCIAVISVIVAIGTYRNESKKRRDELEKRRKEEENQTKMAQQTFFSEYTKRFMEILLHFPENWNEVSTLDEEQKRYLRVYFDLCNEEYFLKDEVPINPTVWKEWEEGMKFTFNQKVVFDYWQVRKSSYPNFNKFVEKELLNNINK